MCPKYQFYSCFFRINIRVRISEPCKIPIRKNFAKNASLDNRGVRISESFKTVCPKYQFYSRFFRINIRVRISEPCKIPIRQNFAKNATLIIEGSEFLNLVKTVCPIYQFYSRFFRINIRVRISEPCKIQIRKTLLKMQTLIIEGSEFLNLVKTSVSKISIL